MRILTLILLCVLTAASGYAQKKGPAANPVFVDKSGVLKWTATGKEAQFFGVNYTVPFAFGYRSHKALGIDPEKAIDADVYHMGRLGFDAFRVHVWDTEIADSAGNLLQNEHLRLFDYLLYKLKEQGIKILITPLAFWGNGYPEPDQNTGSFSSIWNKQKVLVTEAAIKAQERYLQQFFKHVNPYTKTTYGADRDVIAMEINNEPHHSGPQQGATNYVQRMAAAVRSTGWTKPVFYNISESPNYAGAVVKADVDGHSFQWYPTGLVANRTLQGNYLPHVDRYAIPFGDTIAAFNKRAKMVYEFDAGDVLGSYMYPAMARAFRGAGFQWATQFAYDPLYTAHANTEYQTHYVNIAYTPGKAISLMIAGHAFRNLPRNRSYGTYPADTVFGAFRVSYAQDLSEMNTGEAFLYSNNTATQPVNKAALRQVAGVGNSPIVQYSGTGAYFLDKVNDGVWRLEVLPDVFQLSDPFAKASPRKTVRRLVAAQRTMKLQLPGLDGGFVVKDAAGAPQAGSSAGFSVLPGVYYLVKNGTTYVPEQKAFSVAYPVAALPADSVLLTHTPALYADEGGSLQIAAQVAGADTVRLELRHPQAGWQTVMMQQQDGFLYTARVPQQMMQSGPLAYRILTTARNGMTWAFPSGIAGAPYGWDALPAQTWQTVILPKTAPVSLFQAATDEAAISVFTTNWQQNSLQYGAATQYPYITQVMQVSHTEAADKRPPLAWQMFVGNQVQQRSQAAASASKVGVMAQGSPGSAVQLHLVTATGAAYTASINFTDSTMRLYELPLSVFKPTEMLLLPRPYPGFQPLHLSLVRESRLAPERIELLQVVVGDGGKQTSPVKIQLQSIALQ
ncbi:cellulase family glycosylhydrolase [Paracnuella aquatica]|uniref:cellulase family glycosylhydrolase n=1 Tax=Paracnuella aquatica TaxID=2268757 RepID=UPI000DEF1BA2|nr:cellulase family glycosylhydrolase [Paracnuella aquatica]RPD51069.1 membrane or secreted protein [Paracnuella aquatica]